MSQDVRSTGVSPLDPRSVHRPPNPSSSPLAFAREYNSVGARLRQVRGAPVGLYKRQDSRFWWMAYTVKGRQRCESTKTLSKELAKKILKKREAEIALGRFQVGWPGEQMTFSELCEEFLRSHSSTLSPKSQANHQMFLKSLRGFLGDRKLTEIDERA